MQMVKSISSIFSDYYSDTTEEIETEVTSTANPSRNSASFVAPIEEAAMAPDTMFDTYVNIGGRYFFNDPESKNYIPCDKLEENRSREMHQILKVIWGGHFSSPVDETLSWGATVLDVGCGTGAWISSMASDYPLSTFIGIDIAPAFPDRPPNSAAFLKCNVLDGIPFPDNTFDYVRQASLIICIDWEQWKEKVIRELVRVTKPGGYIEIMDWDCKIYNPGKVCAMFDHVRVAHVDPSGINSMSSADVTEAFDELSDEVTIEKFESKIQPYGKWAGRLGENAFHNYLLILEPMDIFYCPIFKITKDEYKELLVEFAKEINSYPSHSKTYRTVIRKLE